MKRLSGLRFIRIAIYLAMAVLLFAEGVWASPTTQGQAEKVVLNWLRKGAVPLGAPLGRQIKEVQTFTDSAGTPAYYVVYLNPAGMVFLPADDLVEPIIGFMPEGSYDPSPTNPLGALVSRDIPGRVLQARAIEARGLEALAPGTPQTTAQRKWAGLSNPTGDGQAMEAGLPGISDVRVTPLVQSYWWQRTVAGQACFNYYTPPYATGNPGNYVCGCVATAMAQLMHYNQYPTTGVDKTKPFDIWVDNNKQTAYLRGGSGPGGAYDWGSMVLVPSSDMTETQRQILGALVSDTGVSVSMSYTDNNSTSNTSTAAWSYVNVFRYMNANYGYNGKANIPLPNLYPMINPNLDGQLPVQLGINQNGTNGHSILADGYGYDTGTMYHHLKMGWVATSLDVWYNLPNFTAGDSSYDTVHTCVYNVFKDGTGEIISGRVTTAGNTPISGGTVTATRSGGGTYTTTTNAKGIYALAKVPSASTYTVRVTKSGYTFNSQVVSTGTSTDNTITSGNVWGVDFKGTPGGRGLGAIQLLLLN